MTSLRRQLTEAQLREQIREGETRRSLRLQGFSFSNAAFSRAFTVAEQAGEELQLSRERLEQLRVASRRAAEARQERARLIRAEEWALPDNRRERRIQRREFNREAREAGARLTRLVREGRRGEAEDALLDVREANRRALAARGISPEQGRRHGLLTEDWNSRALQSVLRKIDNLLAKGLTIEQALDILEQRAGRVADLFREERTPNLLILAREFYTRQQRLDRRRRQRNRARRAA